MPTLLTLPDLSSGTTVATISRTPPRTTCPAALPVALPVVGLAPWPGTQARPHPAPTLARLPARTLARTLARGQFDDRRLGVGRGTTR